LLVVTLRKFNRWQVAEGFEKAPVVEPIYPFEGCKFDLLQVTPGTVMVDQFGLIQADEGLGQGVVIEIANAAD